MRRVSDDGCTNCRPPEQLPRYYTGHLVYKRLQHSSNHVLDFSRNLWLGEPVQPLHVHASQDPSSTGPLYVGAIGGLKAAGNVSNPKLALPLTGMPKMRQYSLVCARLANPLLLGIDVPDKKT